MKTICFSHESAIAFLRSQRTDPKGYAALLEAAKKIEALTRDISFELEREVDADWFVSQKNGLRLVIGVTRAFSMFGLCCKLYAGSSGSHVSVDLVHFPGDHVWRVATDLGRHVTDEPFRRIVGQLRQRQQLKKTPAAIRAIKLLVAAISS